MLAGDVSASFKDRGGAWIVAQAGLMVLVFAFGLGQRGAAPFPGSVLLGGALMLVAAAIGLLGVVAWRGKPTPFPRPRQNAELLRGGIYGFVRHPLYASLILLGLGWALFRDSGPALAAAAVLALFFDAKARQEERWMRERFPEYGAYQKQVRRFIPWIY
jgi:protein-S-isoprenylcysteine O-methyltransferase Ste14